NSSTVWLETGCARTPPLQAFHTVGTGSRCPRLPRNIRYIASYFRVLNEFGFSHPRGRNRYINTLGREHSDEFPDVISLDEGRGKTDGEQPSVGDRAHLGPYRGDVETHPPHMGFNRLRQRDPPEIRNRNTQPTIIHPIDDSQDHVLEGPWHNPQHG